MAEISAFPYVKVLDAERLLGFPEYMRTNELIKVFIIFCLNNMKGRAAILEI